MRGSSSRDIAERLFETSEDANKLFPYGHSKPKEIAPDFMLENPVKVGACTLKTASAFFQEFKSPLGIISAPSLLKT